MGGQSGTHQRCRPFFFTFHIERTEGFQRQGEKKLYSGGEGGRPMPGLEKIQDAKTENMGDKKFSLNKCFSDHSRAREKYTEESSLDTNIHGEKNVKGRCYLQKTGPLSSTSGAKI